jgi:tape measure domain-containing protein
MGADTVVKLRLIADSTQLVASTRGARGEVTQLGTSLTASGSGARTATVDISKYGVAANTTRQNLRGLNADLAQMPGLLRQVGAGLAALGAAAAARQLAELADGWTNLTSKLRLVAKDEAGVIDVRQRLFDLSQRTRSELASTADLFSRLTRATNELRLSEQQRLQITESINKAFQISGATTQEASAAVTQLAQGLASGTLRGEEFNSVAEQAPVLLDLVAKSLGKTRGELRAMAADGQITARVITGALLAGGKQLDQQFAQMTLTIGGASTQLSNAWQRWVGGASDATGAATLVAMAIAGVGNNLNGLALTIGLVATAWGVKLVAGMVLAIAAKQRALLQSAALAAAELNEARAAEAAAAAELAHAQALSAMGGSATRATVAEAALAAAKARTTAATVAATAASTAATGIFARFGATLLSFVGGPIGAVILALGAVAYGVYSAIQAERDHNRQLDESIAKAKETAASLGTLHANWTALATTQPVTLAEGMDAFSRGADTLIEKSRQLGLERQRLAGIEMQVQHAQTSTHEAAGIQLLALVPRLDAQSQRVAALAKEVDNLRTQWTALGGDIAGRLTPALDGAYQALTRLRSANDIGSVLLGVGEGLAAVGRGAQIVTADARATSFIDELRQKSKSADEELKKVGKSREQLAQQTVNEGLAAMKAAGMTDEYRKAVAQFGAAWVKKEAAIDAAKKSRSSELSDGEKLLRQLRDQVGGYGATAEAKLSAEVASKRLTGAQREEAEQLVAQLQAWAALADVVEKSKKAWQSLTDGNVSLHSELASLKDQLAGLSPAQIEYNNAMREANQLAQEAMVLGPATAEQQRLLQDRLQTLADIKAANNELDRRQAIGAGETALRSNIAKTNAEYAKRNALLSGSRDLAAALTQQADRLSATTSAQATYNEGVREANDLAERAIALGFEQADVQDLLEERLKKLAELRDGDDIQNAVAQFGDNDTFGQLVQDIGKVELALEEAIGEGALEKAARLQNALGNMRHAMISGIVDSSQAALRSMQSMTKDGSRAFQAMQVVIQALTVVQAISAVVNQAQGDPYTAFARMAAMAAAVASLGVSISGFGSSGFTDTAAERQEQQGTGSVLGDAAAKSESIANATEITAKATSELVGINRGMLDALRALTDAIGAAVVGLARGAGDVEFGALPTPRNLSSGSIGAALGVPSLAQRFLGGSSRVTDQGLTISGGTLDQLLQGLTVRAYQEVQSRSWAFGSRRTNTGFVDVSDELGTQFQLIIQSIVDTVREGAIALGLVPAEIEAALAAFRVEEIRISLKGLTAEEQEAELQAVFSALFDGLAGSVVPFIEQFQRVGEGLGETLVRIATEVQVMDQVFTQLGIAVDRSDPEKFAQFVDGIVQAAGGLDEAQELWTQFFANFYDKGEQAQQSVRAMVGARDEQLAELGLKPMSKDEFRAAFEQLMPSLTPEEIVDWLRVSELVAAIEDVVSSLMDKFRGAFYSPMEQLEFNQQQTRATADSLLAGLGIDTDITMQEFRQLFEQQLPSLSEDAVVEWLRAAQALATATSAQEQYTDVVSSLMEKFRDAFYSPLEQLEFNQQQTRVSADSLLAGLGIDVDVTMQEFRRLFEQRLPSLSEEAVAEWLRAAQALATATSAQEQYTAAIEQAQANYRGIIDQLAAELGGSDYTNSIASIREWQQQTTDALNAAAAAAGDATAAEYGLVLVREVAEQRIRTAIAQLLQATQSLIQQISDLRGGTSDIESWGAAAVGQIDDIANATDDLYRRQLDGIRSIQEYLDSMLLGDLGGLTAQEQIDEARRQLIATQAAAMGGDAEAMAELPRIADAYLRLLRGSTASGVDSRDGEFGSNWVRDLLQSVVTHGPTVGPGSGAQQGGGGLTPAYMDERDARIAQQEAARLAELNWQLAQHLRDLAGAMRMPVLELIGSLNLNLAQMARDLGINLQNITGASVQSLAQLAQTLGLRLSELTGGLGLQLTALGGGMRELTTQLGIDFNNLTGAQLTSLASLANSLGLSLTEITQSLGLNLTDLSAGVLGLTSQLGIDLNNLTVESAQSLAQLAQRLGVDMSELSQSVGADLGQLGNAQSLLNQALANTIADLPQAQRDQLAPLLTAISAATTEADANAAIAALEAATNGLPPHFRDLLAPYLAGVFPASATTQLDYLSGIHGYASEQAGLLTEIRDNIHLLGRGQNLPGFSVGTSRVPHDMAAMIHRDEMIIDPGTSRFLRRYGISVNVGRSAANDDAGMVDELRRLRGEISELKAELRESSRAVAGAVREEAKADRQQRGEIGRRVENAVSNRSRSG